MPLPMTAIRPRDQRGVTLIELMVALVMLAIGIMALCQLFPLGTRNQITNQKSLSANFLAQQQIEYLNGIAWSHPDLSEGTHPTAVLDHGFSRYWTVTPLDPPLDNVKRVVVTVSWAQGSKMFTATTYMRR